MDGGTVMDTWLRLEMQQSKLLSPRFIRNITEFFTGSACLLWKLVRPANLFNFTAQKLNLFHIEFVVYATFNISSFISANWIPTNKVLTCYYFSCGHENICFL